MKSHAPRNQLAAVTAGLIAALALSALLGCSRTRNAAESDNPTPANSCVIRLPTAAGYKTEPLVIQVSEGRTAYIWQFPPLSEEARFEGIKVPPSTLDDIPPAIARYAEKQKDQPIPVVIIGTDKAKCAAVFDAIAIAKKNCPRAVFYFETHWYGAGRACALTWQDDGQQDWVLRDNLSSPDAPRSSRQDPTSKVFNLTGKPVTISISADNYFYWENEPMMLRIDDFIARLETIKSAAQNGSIRFVVKVEPQTNYYAMLFTLEKLRRMMVSPDVKETAVTIELKQSEPEPHAKPQSREAPTEPASANATFSALRAFASSRETIPATLHHEIPPCRGGFLW